MASGSVGCHACLTKEGGIPYISSYCACVFESEEEMAQLLQASEAPPRAGMVTVGEVNCRFLARDAGQELEFSAVVAVSRLAWSSLHRARIYIQIQGLPDMYVDNVSSFPDDARDPAHHFLPVSEHWLKRFLNTWLAPPPPLLHAI